MLIANWSSTMFISHIYDTHTPRQHLGNCVVQRTACFQTCRDIGIRSSKQQHRSVATNQVGFLESEMTWSPYLTAMRQQEHARWPLRRHQMVGVEVAGSSSGRGTVREKGHE
jgi:hypothetical protein